MTTLTRESPVQPIVLDARAQHAYAACREIARTRARNFYYGLCLTPEPKRSAIYSVYAWMRRADDEVDAADSREAGLRALTARREGLRRLAAGETPAPDDPISYALHTTIQRFPVDVGDLFEMLEGLEEDMEHSGYQTRAELTRYCHRVASTVGLVCVSVWGLREGASLATARRLAERRGVAFQLTNILRDFAQDLDAGRVYLPREDMERRGVTPEGLRRWEPAGACEGLAKDLCGWARGEYEVSAALDGMIHPACRATLWAMTRIYSGLLRKLESRPSRLGGGPRIRLHSAHKAGIAAVAAYKARRDAW